MIVALFALAISVVPATADPYTISFTAGDIKAVMASNQYQDPLSDGTYLWGLWAIRAMPIVSSGGFDILSGSVDAQGLADYWTYGVPNPGIVWADPYGTEIAYFHLRPASEHLDTDAHPLYFIADQPATAFQSYAFNNYIDNGYRRSEYAGVCGGANVNAGDPRCNETNVLPDAALFNFSFNLDPGASLLGWQFLVDGSKYSKGSSSNSLWIEDFIGGNSPLPQLPYGQTKAGDGLTYNVGSGYQVLYAVPEPGTVVLVGLGFAVLAIIQRRA
jgi:hypothetical protein